MIGVLIYSALSFGQMSNAHIITPTSRELEMLNEVNYVRTNPKEYTKFIPDFTAAWGEEDVAEELKNILLTMKPIDSLRWSPALYHDAFTHGSWMKSTGNFEHSKYEWAENLVCGLSTVRFAVLDLLIDAGTESRGHRENLLNPEFKEFAAFEVSGQIQGCPYIFVQEFN